MREFSMNNLRNMKKAVDILSQNIDSALRIRSHLLPDNESVNKHDIAVRQKYWQPDDYYYCKVFDKAVQLEKGGDYYYDKTGRRIDCRGDMEHFHVHCYNWKPQKLIERTDRIYDKSGRFLSTVSLDVAVKWYFKFCMELFAQEGLDITLEYIHFVEDKELF